MVKLHKSQILKKAIDYIRYLQNQNGKLRLELNSYRMRDNNLKIPDLFVGPGSLTPPHSDVSSPALSPVSDSSLSPSPSGNKMDSNDEAFSPGSPIIQTMADRSRMILCMMMFTILVFNPLSLLSSSTSSNFFSDDIDTRSRTILETPHETDNPFWTDSMFAAVLIWLANAVIAYGILVWIFVYSEPTFKRKTPGADTFWRHYKQADLYLAKGSYASACEQYSQALVAAGRPLPYSTVDKICALMWQLSRQMLLRLYIGRWPSKKAGGLFLKGNERDEILEGMCECSYVYHRLHKLHLMGHAQDSSHLLGMYLALSTLNLAECGNVSRGDMAEMMVIAALRAKESLPVQCHITVKSLLFCARRMCAKTGEVLPAAVQWLFTNPGYRFFVSHKWSYNAQRTSMFSQILDGGDPLGYLVVLYREHLLERAVNTLVNPGSKAVDACEDNSHRLTKTSDVIHFIQLLGDTSTGSGGVSLGGAARDDVCFWWAAVCGLAGHWLLGDDEEAKTLYQTIEALPEPLQVSDDPLPLAVLHAFRARRQLGISSPSTVLSLCDSAGTTLGDSINISSCKEANSMLQSVQVIVADWILNVRTVVWESESALDCDTLTVAPPEMLRGFQSDLADLRKLVNNVPGVLQRVFLHEATLRMMAGASPARTQQLLDRSLRFRYKTPSLICGKDKLGEYGGEREHAAALMLACKHLPSQLLSTPGERAGMLTEAAKTLEKIGDTRRLQDCYTLMKSMGSSASAY